MGIVVVHVADWSSTPGARYRKDGPWSAEEFRDDILLPLVRQAMDVEDHILVNLGGAVAGFVVTWLEETFGGLVREFKIFEEADWVMEHVDVTGDKEYEDEARAFMWAQMERSWSKQRPDAAGRVAARFVAQGEARVLSKWGEIRFGRVAGFGSQTVCLSFSEVAPLNLGYPAMGQRATSEDFNLATGFRFVWGQGRADDVDDWKLVEEDRLELVKRKEQGWP